MITLKTGDKAPDFKGRNQDGQEISLNDYKGKKLVLYFYPKDNTSGCTAEACSLRNAYDDFLDKGYEIVGVSPDSEKSHVNFISKNNLPFPLIADTDKEIASSYGVWGEKKMYGRTYMGILRTTFIIDENGFIEKVIEKVDTKNHADQLLK
ncbi:MAG: thioredoxin-dependent thiol peroxidase [Bacteroidales bacterium]|jgi:peroxiredoxin Q/BCP|nr:thioredoxin-dependent thiol peroxidase [Bacteroidales bacterium]